MSILVEYSTDFKGRAVAREVVERPAGEIFIGQMAKEFVMPFPNPCGCAAHLSFRDGLGIGNFR